MSVPHYFTLEGMWRPLTLYQWCYDVHGVQEITQGTGAEGMLLWRIKFKRWKSVIGWVEGGYPNGHS